MKRNEIKIRNETIETEILNYIKSFSNPKGECTLTDEQIGKGLYGNYDVKTKVKITSCLLRLRKKNIIESIYSRVIFTQND